MAVVAMRKSGVPAFCGRVQGTGVDCMISQPGLVKTELNGRKLDHRKLSAIGVDLATKVYGQDASQAANCLIRPATDPTVDGERSCTCVHPASDFCLRVSEHMQGLTA